MRYLVLSDIHGGADELSQALTYFDQYQCDYLVLLGDLLNHGPRNKVPESYEPPKVAQLLNAMNTKIISVRGNCDSEVDSMMFNFPCNAPYGYLLVSTARGVQRIFLTHGHLHKIDSGDGSSANELRDKLGLKHGDIVLSGHTHVAGIFMKPNGLININPGSTTLPKGGTKAGFGLILEDRIELRDLDDNLVAHYSYDLN
ncbi:MAG TPA: phosphodiesterase [Candidatus Anaerobiospirillum stercoravium]|nr:phosphodiesterase [Candidatus Anaerobiospirillum stercoravium]